VRTPARVDRARDFAELTRAQPLAGSRGRDCGARSEPLVFGRVVRLSPRWQSLDALAAAHPEPRLDLGCGFAKPPGFIGIDDGRGELAQVANENGPDIYLDLQESPLPFADDSVEEVRASHLLEHLSHGFEHVLSETRRVLRPGGIFLFAVPYANSADGLMPGHQLFLTEDYFDKSQWFDELFVIVNADWDPTPEWERLPSRIRDEIGFDLARRVMFNVCAQMKIWVTPRKGEWLDAPRRTCAEAARLFQPVAG